MDTGLELARARRRAGLSQRELAARAGTSQATISAYEAGRKQPSVAVLERLLRSAGAELRVTEAPARRSTSDLERAGRQFADVLLLAEALPYRPARRLAYPRLPRAA
jgi:transcriptional regulator with XRE-family HTH domain